DVLGSAECACVECSVGTCVTCSVSSRACSRPGSHRQFLPEKAGNVGSDAVDDPQSLPGRNRTLLAWPKDGDPPLGDDNAVANRRHKELLHGSREQSISEYTPGCRDVPRPVERIPFRIHIIV